MTDSDRPLWLVDVTALLRWPGSSRSVSVDLDLPDTGITSAAAHRVTGTLELESLTDAIRSIGTVTVHWSGPCRRCLELVEGATDVAVDEIFERRPTEGDTYRLADHQIDLGAMVREAVLLALPLAPLCADGCAGPAPDAFPTGPPDEDADAEGEEPSVDPRWAALDALKDPSPQPDRG